MRKRNSEVDNEAVALGKKSLLQFDIKCMIMALYDEDLSSASSKSSM